MRWPWSKKENTEAEAPSPPSAPLPEIRAPRGEWRSLPAVQRVVDAHPMVNPPADFAAGLATRRPTTFLGGLGHAVSGSAPGGVVSVQAIRTSDASDLPVLRALPPADAAPSRTVQRSFAPSPSAVLPIAEPAAAGVETPAAWELPVVASETPTASEPSTPDAVEASVSETVDEPSASVAPTLGSDTPPPSEPSAPVVTHESAPMPDTPVVTRPVGGPVGPPMVQRSTTSVDLPSPPPTRRRAGIGPPISSSVDGAVTPDVAPTLGTADPLGGETVQRAVTSPATPPTVARSTEPSAVRPVVRPHVTETPSVQRLAVPPGMPEGLVASPESTATDGPSSFGDIVAASSSSSFPGSPVSSTEETATPSSEVSGAQSSTPESSAPLTSASPLTVSRAVDTPSSSPSMSVSSGSDMPSDGPSPTGPDLPDLTVARSVAPGTPTVSTPVSTFGPPPGGQPSVPGGVSTPEFGGSSPETTSEPTFTDSASSEQASPAFSEAGAPSAEPSSPVESSSDDVAPSGPEPVAQLIGERGITPPSVDTPAPTSGDSTIGEMAVGPTVQRTPDIAPDSPGHPSVPSFARSSGDAAAPASLQRLASGGSSASTPSGGPASPAVPLTVARSVASSPTSSPSATTSFTPPVVARLIGDRGLPASTAAANPISSAVRQNDADGGSSTTGDSPSVVVPLSYGDVQMSAQTFTTGPGTPVQTFTSGPSTSTRPSVFTDSSARASVQTFTDGWSAPGSLTVASGSGGAAGNGGSISVLGAPGRVSAAGPVSGAGPLVQRAVAAPPVMPMASPPPPPPPPPVIVEAPQPYFVQRADDAAPPPAAEAPPPAAPEPAPAAPPAPGAPGAPGAPKGEAPEELLAKLYDPLLRRLRAELRHDRERRGIVTDLWH